MKTIFAVDKKWGLGKNNDLLFNLKADMRHFVENTRGKVVVMGSNTLLSFPGGMPLKNRVNIVLNPNGEQSDADAKGYVLVKSLDELFNEIKKYDADNVYVVGGAMMYRTMLPYCDTAIVTKVDADGDAQVFHQNLDELPDWHLTSQSNPIDDNGYSIRFCTYKNDNVKPY